MSELARRWNVRRIEGTEVHWLEVGSGPPLVLLHGLSDSHRTWSRVAAPLARSHRVLMPDLPGHGYSGRPDASYALAWHARVIGGWLDAIGIGEADVVGHSYGGGVAQTLLLEWRGRVRRLGLVAAGGLGREVMGLLRVASLPHVVERVGQPFMALGTRMVLRALHADFGGDETRELAWMNARPGSARALARTVRDVIDLRGQSRGFFQHVDDVRDIPPTALFWGERDPVIPVSHAEQFAERVENVTITRFARCGHFPHREQPAEFVRALGALVHPPSLPAPRVRPLPSAPERASWLRHALRVRRGVRGVIAAR